MFNKIKIQCIAVMSNGKDDKNEKII